MRHQSEHDIIISAAFEVTLATMFNLHEAEREHLFRWLRTMLKDKTELGHPRSKEKRAASLRRIVKLYGRPKGFARNLRIVLWERSLSPRALAEMLNMTTARAFEWLTGNKNTRSKTIAKVAYVLGLDEEDLDPDAIKRRR